MEHKQLVIRCKMVAPKDGGKSFTPFQTFEYIDVKTKGEEKSAFVNTIVFSHLVCCKIEEAFEKSPNGYFFVKRKTGEPIDVLTAYNKGGYRRDVAVIDIKDLELTPLTADQIQRVNKIILDTRKKYSNTAGATATAAAATDAQNSTYAANEDLPF